MGKGKHPSIACTAQKRKLWQLKHQNKEYHADMIVSLQGISWSMHRPQKNMLLYCFIWGMTPCQHAAEHSTETECISYVRWELCGCKVPCTAHQCVSTSAWPPLSGFFHHPEHLSSIFQQQADSIPVLVICSSCQHVAQETKMDCLPEMSVQLLPGPCFNTVRVVFHKRGKVLQISCGTVLMFLYTHAQNYCIWIWLCMGNRYKEKGTEMPLLQATELDR